MPYMERLTWGGVAMHAGNLPGYPASHGCVRRPFDFAKKLYTVTGKGTTVIGTDGTAAPSTTSHPGLLLSGDTVGAASGLGTGGFLWTPQRTQAVLFQLFSAVRINESMYAAMVWRSDARLSGKRKRCARLAVTPMPRLPRRIATEAASGAP
jgi:hypothetical protein